MNIGKNIKTMREKAEMTQSELSLKIGTSQQLIAQYEKGYIVPTVLKLKALADALHCRTDDFLKED